MLPYTEQENLWDLPLSVQAPRSFTVEMQSFTYFSCCKEPKFGFLFVTPGFQKAQLKAS